MARDPEAIAAALIGLLGPDARGRLLARGMARGMIWKDGVVPDEGPAFSASLTSDLLDFGYGVLALTLELRDANRTRTTESRFETREAFGVAAEAIESAVRRGEADGDQGRHLVIAAAAFHLAGYAARSFSLLPVSVLERNLASPERVLALLLRRDLISVRDQIVGWPSDPARGEGTIVERLSDPEDDFGPEDAAVIALSGDYHRLLGLADSALLWGDAVLFGRAVEGVEALVTSAASIGNVPFWWVATLTSHLLRDLWDQSLHARLPAGPVGSLSARWPQLRRDFIAQMATRRPPQSELWPSQLAAAARAVDPADDLVIALPTSAGKTRIAELCILRTLADEKRVVYVTPLRALSAQAERVLARTFVPLNATVTSLYGASGALADTKTLANANIVVATPEKLDFALRQDPDVLGDVGLVVFDEGHMIGLGSREIRYEVLIQRLLRRKDANDRRIVCLSAMFNPDDGHFKDFGDWLRDDAPGDSIHVRWRPTRQRFATLDWNERFSSATLSFLDGERPYVPRFLEQGPARRPRRTPFPKTDLEFCLAAADAFVRDGHSVLVYSPQRSNVESLANDFIRVRKQGYLRHIHPPAPGHLAPALAIGREWLGDQHPALEALKIGVGTHHGALPRPFLDAVEKLLDARRLSIVVASPTLAQGIDLGCSVLLFRSLQRYENDQWVPITAAEFGNVVGRVGRAFVDLDGIAVVHAFASSKQFAQRQVFEKLIRDARGQQLRSGLALLIWKLGQEIAPRLGVPGADLLEHVLNHQNVWDDGRLSTETGTMEEDDGVRSIEEHLADLDVAILSLVDPLDVPVEELGGRLDEVLQKSLWRRTLAHEPESVVRLEEVLLRSRAEWLWRGTTDQERTACFYAGLGRKPGLFLHQHRETLIDTLANLQAAVAAGHETGVAAAAAAFAEVVMEESFFALRSVPEDWREVLVGWVQGRSFGELLEGRGTRDMQKVQAFIQDGVVFRLVWAAEAVRAQVRATEHERIPDLGEGPALVLTFGVPSIPAALLCQAGYPSRTGAMWAVRERAPVFTDFAGLRKWLKEDEKFLNDRAFWDSEDHYVLWTRFSVPTGSESIRPWRHKTETISVTWKSRAPGANNRARIIPSGERSVLICGADLATLGTARLPFSTRGVALDGTVTAMGKVRISYFGPEESEA